jgi:hypothetical protein
MVDYWNTLLKDEPAWSLLVSILSLGVSVWASTWVAKRSARQAVATALDLANRQELATRLGHYRNQFVELLDFLTPRNAPSTLETNADETLSEVARHRLAAQGSTLAHLSQFMEGHAFTTDLQLLSSELLLECTDVVDAIHMLHAELHHLGLGKPMTASKDETLGRLRERWEKAASDLSLLYKRIHRQNYF